MSLISPKKGIIMFYPIPAQGYYRKNDCRCELGMCHEGDHEIEYVKSSN